MWTAPYKHGEDKPAATILRGHEAEVKAVTFSPDGRFLISAGHDFTVRLWDVVSGQNVETLRLPFVSSIRVAFHPNGTHWVYSSANSIFLMERTVPVEPVLLECRSIACG